MWLLYVVVVVVVSIMDIFFSPDFYIPFYLYFSSIFTCGPSYLVKVMVTEARKTLPGEFEELQQQFKNQKGIVADHGMHPFPNSRF